MPEPPAIVGVAAMAAAYAVGVRRARTTGGPGISGPEVGLFLAGLAVVAVAVGPPLDSAAETSVVAHMVQHVLLLSVAGPLLAMGAPGRGLRWLLPGEARRERMSGWVPVPAAGSEGGWVTWTAAAIALQTGAMWLWHAPGPYQAALHHHVLHAVEHASFLGTSVLFWWVVAGSGRRLRYGAALLTLFAAALPGTVLGMGMTLARTPWYPQYVSGSPADAVGAQQLAGVVMWSFGGLAYVVAGVVLFYRWLAGVDGEPSPRGVVEAPRLEGTRA